MRHLPDGYRMSAERTPVPGTSITEGIGLEDITTDDNGRRSTIERANRDDDTTLALTALGLAGAALATVAYRARKRRNKE